MSSIQASPASDPDVPAEPTISGMPALTARVIMISVSRLTAALENMQAPVARGPGPGSVLPASQPIIRAPREIALSSDSARNPEPSMPVAETSGNDAIAMLLDAIAGEDIACRIVRKPMDAGLYFRPVIDTRVGSSPGLGPHPPTTVFGATRPVADHRTKDCIPPLRPLPRLESSSRNWCCKIRFDQHRSVRPAPRAASGLYRAND